MSRQPFRKTLAGKLVITVAALAGCWLAMEAFFRTYHRQFFPDGYGNPLLIMGTFAFIGCPFVVAVVIMIHLWRLREHDVG